MGFLLLFRQYMYLKRDAIVKEFSYFTGREVRAFPLAILVFSLYTDLLVFSTDEISKISKGLLFNNAFDFLVSHRQEDIHRRWSGVDDGNESHRAFPAHGAPFALASPIATQSHH